MMAVRFGMARGIANEAGLGSGPIAHATATSTPIRQATIGMLDVFITTMIVCSMTGFAILVTGEWTAVGAQGASLTARAFETALPGVGSAIVAISLVMFAFTILGWCVYGERSAIFLFGDRIPEAFPYLHHRRAHRRSGPALDLVWILADTFNALMAFPTYRRASAEPCGVQNRTGEHTALKRTEARTFAVLISIRLYLGIVTVFRSSPFSVIPIDGKALYRYLANFSSWVLNDAFEPVLDTFHKKLMVGAAASDSFCLLYPNAIAQGTPRSRASCTVRMARPDRHSGSAVRLSGNQVGAPFGQDFRKGRPSSFA